MREITSNSMHEATREGMREFACQAVGVIGVGLMGLAMAQRLREQGHVVWVRDLLPAREAIAAAQGAQVAATPAALAARCDLVIVAVVDAAQVREALFGANGLASATRRPHTVLLCPTIAPEDVADAARQLEALGIRAIDAPMSGGPARARAGQMSLMLAGDPAAIAAHDTVLAALSNQRFTIGPHVGDAARTKLVNNLLAAINLAGAAEALALARQLGLDPALTLAVIERSSGQSWIGSDRLRRALAGDTTPQAQMALLAKDAGLAMAMAAQAGLAPALGAQAAQAFGQACASGLAQSDDARQLAWAAEAMRARA
jgi:3-hydroxyisobutyrate dehydrogenase